MREGWELGEEKPDLPGLCTLKAVAIGATATAVGGLASIAAALWPGSMEAAPGALFPHIRRPVPDLGKTARGASLCTPDADWGRDSGAPS